MALQIGQPAPDFTLYNTDRQPVTLSDLKGKNVLLLFFPLAFTSVCTAELCSVRDNLKMYEDLNVTPFGISVDSTAALKKFKEEQAFNFSLLSDFNKEVSTAYETIYEVWGMGMRGVSKRSAFLVDSEGIIQYAEVLENAGEQPDFNAIKEKLAVLTM
jgi:glutaredoxin-dependent peroxiredoxin